MKNLIISLSFLLALLPAAMSQNQPDAEYNLIRRTYKANNDGSIDITVRKELKLIRNRAITAYADKGETFILYNPAFERLTVNESYTVRSDGSKVTTPANAFINQLPSSCQDCGRYNHLREMVVVHTALEYGCTIVLDYTIHRQNPKLYDNFPTVLDCPVKQFEVVCQQSGDIKFHVTAPDKFKYNEATSTYCASNIAQSVVDRYLPDRVNNQPFVISTADGYDALFAFQKETLPQAASFLSNLYNDDKLQYACDIRDHVVDNIRLNNIAPSLAGFRHASAAETWASNCGTAVDKAVLLCALFNQVGFDASVAFEGNDCMVSCVIDGLSYRFSPTRKNKAVMHDAAIPAAIVTRDTTNLEWTPLSLGDSYYRIALPATQNSHSIKASQLTSMRQQPLKVTPSEISHRITLTIPDSVNIKMLTKEVDYHSTQAGLWDATITLRRTGNRVEVLRSLKITTQEISPKYYKAFRQMLQKWDTTTELLFKKQW